MDADSCETRETRACRGWKPFGLDYPLEVGDDTTDFRDEMGQKLGTDIVDGTKSGTMKEHKSLY